jgi:hypothetical protein
VRLVTRNQPHRTWALPQQLHIDGAERARAPRLVASMRPDHEIVSGIEYFLDQRRTRPPAKDPRRRLDAGGCAGEDVQSLTAMLDEITLAIRRDVVPGGGGHRGQKVDDLHARAASPRERYRLIECRIVGGRRVDVDKDAL